MLYKIALAIFLCFTVVRNYSQPNLDYYLKVGNENSPVLNDYKNQEKNLLLENEMNQARNSAFNVYLSADYLFAPYLNNKGKLISANPAPDAIGYDVGVTNGGLYSAQINVEKNLFNSGVIKALEKQNKAASEQNKYELELARHGLQKQITDLYLTAYKSGMDYELSKEICANLTSQLKILSNLVEKGFSSAQDYLLLKIELKNQEISRDESFQQYKNDLSQLRAQCGINETTEVRLEKPELEISGAIGISGFNRKFEFDSVAISANRSVFESQYLPQIKVFMNAGLNAVELDGIQRKFGFSAGLNFSLPLFDGNQESINSQQSKILLETVNSYKNFTSINLASIKQNSLKMIRQIEKNLTVIGEQIQDYKKLMEISGNNVKKGQTSMLDYLTMLKNYIDLRRTKLENETKYEMEINNYNYWNW